MTTAVRPQAGAPREYHFPTFERRTLANGARLIVAPVHKLPVVSVSVVVDAGAVTDPRGKEGLAQLTARTITEGTQRSGGEALTERLELLGTSFDASADWDASVLGLTVLTDKLADAFALLAEVLTTPTFPEPAVERLKGERVAEILQVESEPRELADERFDGFVYGEGSRFHLPLGGTRASVERLTRADVAAFYASRYRPPATTIIVAGDVSADDAERIVAHALRDWGGDAPEPVAVDDTPARTTRAVQMVRKGDAPQSEVRVGHVGVPRAHPDYFVLTVTNAVLGGLFSSRINLNLREAHGYTYGAHSEFDWRRESGPFVVSTAVASNVTAEAVKETLYEIDRMRAEPITADELSLATSYLDGVFPIRFETTTAIAAALSTLVIYELPDDWYDTYRARVRAVTADDVLRAMREHVRADELQTVIVGDADVIRGPVEALGIGPVTVV